MKNRQWRRTEEKIYGKATWTDVGKLTAAKVGKCSGAIVNVLQVVVDGRPAAWIQKKEGARRGVPSAQQLVSTHQHYTVHDVSWFPAAFPAAR